MLFTNHLLPSCHSLHQGPGLISNANQRAPQHVSSLDPSNFSISGEQSCIETDGLQHHDGRFWGDQQWYLLSLLARKLHVLALANNTDSVSDVGHSHITQADLEDQRTSQRFSRQRIPSDSPEDQKSTPFKINRRTISDAILGLSDGLTVPFALSAGLSGLGTTKIVILGGLAELVAGGISMGLGGFLGARSELYATLCTSPDSLSFVLTR